MKRLSRRHAVIAAAVIVTLVILVLVWAMNSPATGEIVQPQRTTSKPARVLGTARFDGEQFSFTYPASYRVKKHDIDTVEEEVVLLGVGPKARRIVVSVISRDINKLDDFPSVQTRLRQPESYSSAETSVANERALEFTNTNGGFERVVFVSRPGEILTIAVTGTSGSKNEDLASDYELVSESLTWR